jgi:hypothetical protein
MMTAAQCRRLADQAEQDARWTSLKTHREQLLEAARQWRALAEERERPPGAPKPPVVGS